MLNLLALLLWPGSRITTGPSTAYSGQVSAAPRLEGQIDMSARIEGALQCAPRLEGELTMYPA